MPGYYAENETVVIGLCPYGTQKDTIQGLYVEPPQNVTELNDFLCSGLNRTGLMCSQCQAGLGTACHLFLCNTMSSLYEQYSWLDIVRVPCHCTHYHTFPGFTNVPALHYFGTIECLHTCMSGTSQYTKFLKIYHFIRYSWI